MKKVVVADDSKTARMFIVKCLEIAGARDAEFVEVKDGLEAYEFVSNNECDLLVTDLNMPKMNGKELLEKLSDREKLDGLSCIVITSASNEARDKELLDLGADAVLPKPISPMAVSEIIEELF
jgi:two-component system chemotaxis response regulator CheY